MNYEDFRKLWINRPWALATLCCEGFRRLVRGMAGQVSEVQLEITPSDQIVRIVLMEADGATTEFRFADWKENLELSDSRFQFTPPPGVETVEGELGP